MSGLAAFLVVAVVVIVVPGQDTALTIKNTLAGGRRSGAFTALGVSTGLAVWTLAASAGLAALLIASEPLFLALRIVGAGYLFLLGAQALLAALRRRPAEHTRSRGRALSPRVAFRQGAISNLGNPKIAVFFTSLLPQFGGTSFAALFGLGLVFCALTLVWLAAYAVVVARAGDVLRRPAVRRFVDATVGVVLVAFGLRLATERR